MDKYWKIGHLYREPEEYDENERKESWTKSDTYKTHDEALTAAQRQANKDTRDIQILEVTHVVRFPVPTYPVEAVV